MYTYRVALFQTRRGPFHRILPAPILTDVRIFVSLRCVTRCGSVGLAQPLNIRSEALIRSSG